ncbi:MAG: hypothetical protein WCO22_17830 [Betaproteobacteria bacterium]
MKLFVLLVSSLALAACGGGGSAGGIGALGANDFTVTGAVVKGPMAKAKVSVYRATEAGPQGEPLADVMTNEDGTYTAKVSNYDGVVVVVASVVPGQTTMFDESTGQSITPAVDFTLRASFAAKRGDTQIAQINPYTEAATASALGKTGGLTAINVAQANSDMAATMTFNPLTTAAEFDSNKKPKNAAAVAMAAVSEMALSGAQGCTGDQAKKVSCVVAAMAKKGLVDKDLKAELSEKIRVIATIAGLPSQGLSDAAGSPVTAATPVSQAKAFMGALRSNAKALDGADLSLQTGLYIVLEDLKVQALPMAESNLEVINLALQAVKYWDGVVVAQSQQFSNFLPNQAGDCGLYQIDRSTPATSAAQAKWIACRTYPKGIDSQNNGAVQWRLSVSLAPSAVMDDQFVVYTQTWRVEGNNLTRYGNGFLGNEASLQAVRDGGKVIVGVNLTGEVSPAISIVRNTPSELATAPNTQYKHKVELAALATESAGVTTLALSGAFDLQFENRLESRLALIEGSYLRLARSPDGTVPNNAAKDIMLKVKGNSLTTGFTGDLKVGDYKSDKTGSATAYRPTLVSFKGDLQRNGKSFLTGLLSMDMLDYDQSISSLPASGSNVKKSRRSFDGSLVIPDRPALKLTLSSTETASDRVTEVAGGQYVQGDQTVNITGTRTPVKTVTTMESTTGVKVVLDSSLSDYPLTVNNQAVGRVSGKRIDYTDGSYETF